MTEERQLTSEQLEGLLEVTRKRYRGALKALSQEEDGSDGWLAKCRSVGAEFYHFDDSEHP